MLILINIYKKNKCGSTLFYFSELKFTDSGHLRCGIISGIFLSKWLLQTLSDLEYLKLGDIIKGIELSDKKIGGKDNILQFKLKKSSLNVYIIHEEIRRKLINDNVYDFRILFYFAKMFLYKSKLFKCRASDIKYLQLSNKFFDLCENHFSERIINYIYFYRAIVNYRLGLIIWFMSRSSSNNICDDHYMQKKYFLKSYDNLKDNRYPDNKKKENDYIKMLGAASFFAKDYYQANRNLSRSYKNYNFYPPYGIKQEKLFLLEYLWKSRFLGSLQDLWDDLNDENNEVLEMKENNYINILKYLNSELSDHTDYVIDIWIDKLMLLEDIASYEEKEACLEYISRLRKEWMELKIEKIINFT